MSTSRHKQSLIVSDRDVLNNADSGRSSSNRQSSLLGSPRFLLLLGVTLTAITVLYLGWFTHIFEHKDGLSQEKDGLIRRKPIPVIDQPVISSTSSASAPSSAPVHFQTDNSKNHKVDVRPRMKSPPAGITNPNPAIPPPQSTLRSLSLPGGSKHPILSYSQDQLDHTPIDKLMAGYAVTSGGPDCEADFGYDLVTRWRQTKQTNCHTNSDGNSNSKGPLQTSIDCYLMHQNHHHGNGDNLCVYHNVAVDLSLLADKAFTDSVIHRYVDSRHEKQAYPPYPKGFIKGDCSLDTSENHWQAKVMPGWNNDLTVNAFLSTSEKEIICSEWIDHPVIMTERDTFANFFHDSEDFVNVFLAMAILGYTKANLQVMLMDLYPAGPFYDMWREVFSRSSSGSSSSSSDSNRHVPMMAWDLKQKYGHLATSTTKGHVCFKELAIGIYGPAAPTTICSWDTPCKGSTLVRAYSDYVIRSLDLQGLTHYAKPSPSKEIIITYMSRRASKEWPERKYCNSSHSFFDCQLWHGFGPRALGRMVRNDDQVIAALKSLELESFENGAKVRLMSVDFNILSFKQQIAVDLATDIMVGPHGAGLMHNIFMRDRAVLVELFVDGSGANRHFHNLASWYGRSYDGVGIGNPVPVKELLQIMRKHINQINLNAY